jgi:NAD(P)-dependent dehydrogenase (short-subunit alcohol dehydrogenase family)
MSPTPSSGPTPILDYPPLFPFPGKVPHQPFLLSAFDTHIPNGRDDYTQREFFDVLLAHGEETRNPQFAILQQFQPFKDRVVFITGGANGIGETIAQTFRLGGARVAVFDLDASVEKKFELDRDGILGVRCNLTDWENMPRHVHSAYERLQACPDIVVLNAGIFPASKSVRNYSPLIAGPALDTNGKANMNFVRLCLPMLQTSAISGLDSNVVVVGTRNVKETSYDQVLYNSAKALLVQMVKSWSQDPNDILPYRIRFNGVHPSSVFDHSKLWTPEKMEASAAKKFITVEELKSYNLLKNELGAADIAAMISCVAGPCFRNTTGHFIPVDGGFPGVIAAE